MRTISNVLLQPLTMSMFVSQNDLTVRALREREVAGTAAQCAEANALVLEAELHMLLTAHPELAETLSGVRKAATDLLAEFDYDLHDSQVPAQAA